MINALFFSHSSELTGAERSLLELVKELAHEHDTSCTVVLPSAGPLENLLHRAGAATIIAPINWWCTAEEMPDEAAIKALFSQSFAWLYENLDTLRKINPEIILTNTLVIPWGAVAASLLNLPHIWMVNEFGELDHGLKFYLPFDKVLEFIDASSDMIVTRSKAIQTELFPDHGPDKLRTIYRHIDIKEMEAAPGQSESQHFRLPQAFRLIIFGTVMKSKGQEDAVRSVIELVKKRGYRLELLIAGHAEPGYLNYLQEIIRDEQAEGYIHIIPFQYDILPIVKAADIVLVCSRMEAFGRSIHEAMLLEKPVIATFTGGTPEMIADGESGLLYTPGDYIQLADYIERLLKNPNLRETLAQNAVHFAGRTFTKEAYGGEYQILLKDLINEVYQNKEGASWFFATQFELLAARYESAAARWKLAADQFASSIETLTAEYESAAARCKLAADQFESRIETLTADIEEHDALVQSLSSETSRLKIELDQARADISKYSLSRSWRITRPFRDFYYFFKGKKNT